MRLLSITNRYPNLVIYLILGCLINIFAVIAPTKVIAGDLCPPGGVTADQYLWKLYVNSRFGTQVCYPADLFLPEPPPQNNDGQTFLSNDGQTSLRVFGGFNALGQTLRDHEAWLLETMPGVDVTYDARGSNWFVFSGYQAQFIFYEKRLFSDDGETIHGLSFRYPSSQRKRLDPIVTTLSRSFGFVGD